VSLPEVNADKVAQRRKDDERIEFLRRCAVSFVGSGSQVGDIAHNCELGTSKEACNVLVASWSELFDSIEATRKP
jgi:hypothetical protein